MTDVLIVEPSKDMSIVLAQALARKEISSMVAHSAQSAIKQADLSSPKLVILEPLMPRHNGLEFIHEFKSYSEWLDVPIIIYSQISADELGVSGDILKDMSIFAHLYKPTSTLEDLVSITENAIQPILK